MPDPMPRRLMPHHPEACDLPTIAAMLYEDNATVPVTEERWLTIANSVISDMKVDIRPDLVKRLERAKTQAAHLLGPLQRKTEAESTKAEEGDHGDYFSVLDRASSLFRCDTYGCKELFGHAAIFNHHHFRNMRWVHILPRLQYEVAAEPVVYAVLKALRLPEDTPLAVVEQLNGQLVCLCGHPDFRKPLTFRSLVCSILIHPHLAQFDFD